MKQILLRWRRHVVLPAAGVIGVLLLLELRAEWRSVERANRLYRSGDAAGAAAIFDSALTTNRGAALESELRYNLGTALLRSGRLTDAEAELVRGLGTLEPETFHRDQFNLGYRYLSAALGASAPDSAVQLLIAAVDSYRGALRVEPGAEAARRNLEIAQARLDSILASRPPKEITFATRAKSKQEIEKDEVAQGEDEAAASGDGGPMTQAGANRILDAAREDPAKMIRRVLFVEGPGRWENQGKRW